MPDVRLQGFAVSVHRVVPLHRTKAAHTLESVADRLQSMRAEAVSIALFVVVSREAMEPAHHRPPGEQQQIRALAETAAAALADLEFAVRRHSRRLVAIRDAQDADT